MPETEPLPGEPVVVKFRYSGFYATELELLLREMGIRTLVVAGVNTNNCVLHTSFDAHARDFGVVLLEDCCGSMNGEEYHWMGLRQVEASIGWLSTVDEIAARLGVTFGSSALNCGGPR
jgi:nicotinamidase-related amidase